MTQGCRGPQNSQFWGVRILRVRETGDKASNPWPNRSIFYSGNLFLLSLIFHDTVDGRNPAPPVIYIYYIYICMWNPMKHEIFSISTGAGFLPSTVAGIHCYHFLFMDHQEVLAMFDNCFLWSSLGTVEENLSRKDYIHPGKFTWNLAVTHLQRKCFFQSSISMFHVNFQGCKCFLQLNCST